MVIDVSQQDGVSVMKLSGRMDATTVPEFDTQWKKLLADGSKKIAVDLGELEYISSAGLRGILMLAKMSRAQQASIAFCSMQSMVADMFRISGFTSILNTQPDLTAAIAALK